MFFYILYGLSIFFSVMVLLSKGPSATKDDKPRGEYYDLAVVAAAGFFVFPILNVATALFLLTQTGD